MDLEPAAFVDPIGTPRPLTATECAEAALRRHRQEPRDFAVEADGQWPTLHQVFEIISHDGGDGAGHPVYFVPEEWTGNLDAIQAALAAVTPDDLETFAIGEEGEAAAIAARDPRLAVAHELQNAFFEDWPDVWPPVGRVIRGGYAQAAAEVRAMLGSGPSCRACGCTEIDACSEPFSGDPCDWAAANLCTACVGIVQRVFTPGELTFLLHAAGGGDLNLTRPDATALTAEGVLALRETLKVIAPPPSDATAIG